jgi:protein TonB
MSAISHFGARESQASSAADPEALAAPHALGRDNPVQLLREAIAQLNSSNGDLPDRTQVANLLAEAREALERANVIARAAAQCEELLRDAQFEKAFEALDAGLRVYPADPALLARRRQVEERQKAFHCAAAVRAALEEAQWLLNQDRPDLAVHFLGEKAAELPDQPALVGRMGELEAVLLEWQQKRDVHAAVGRAATLEQSQQWEAALTILEEALRSYPASEELTGAARRVRDQMAEHERQKRLARRLELIRQKIASQAWRQAFTLLENAHKEFPGAPELNRLRREVDAGLRRSECEDIVTEVRQYLADGELEQAEQILRRGLGSFEQEPALEALREELEANRRYREELRTAQVLFGRRQLQEAEGILGRLAAQGRPEAQALLDAVREARAATEEENFYERGRERALKLIHEQQFGPAVDLLRNLLGLFPGNPILERDLMTAQSGLDQRSAESGSAAGEEHRLPESLPATAALQLAPYPETQIGTVDSGSVRESAPSRLRRAAIAGTASLVLVSAGGAAWKLARKGIPVSTPEAPQRSASTPPPDTQPGNQGAAAPIETLQNVSSPLPTPQPLATAKIAPNKGKTQPPVVAPLRTFVLPARNQTPVDVQGSIMPLPPGTAVLISAETFPLLPPDLVKLVSVPPPPQAAPPAAASPEPVAFAPAPEPARPIGGRTQPAQLISNSLPDYPELARRRGLFGVVKLHAVIDAQGAVKDVRIVSGDALLVAASIRAVQRWKYKPATLNGQPVASNVEIQLSFADRVR